MRDRKVNWSNTVTIPSQNKKPNNKTKPNKKHTSKQTKTHNTKQTEQGKSGRQTSYVTSVMSKRDILVSSLVLVWQVKQRQNRKHKHHKHEIREQKQAPDPSKSFAS
jgi:hypothetical protein